MSRFWLFGLLALASLKLTACDAQEQGPEPLESLFDTAWILERFESADGVKDDAGGADLFIHFHDPDEASGVSFANGIRHNFFAIEYSENAGEITFGEGFVTEIAEPPGSRLDEFMLHLVASRSYKATETVLQLEQESGATLVFEATDPDVLASLE